MRALRRPLLVGTGVIGATAAIVTPAVAGNPDPTPPGMTRMHELMIQGNPGMARMHELMEAGNPGMERMHELMMRGTQSPDHGSR